MPKTKQVQLLFSLLVLAISLPNPAPYIKAKDRPLNIAHRGLSSVIPQNTLQAFQAALYQGADFIELDVVYTKQKIALVMHDPYLTRITNIKKFPQFATRYETREMQGFNVTDWWVDRFTLSQLKRLGIKQDQAPGRITIFDYKFTFPTLDQVVKMVIEFNNKHKGQRNPDGRLAGILIEAKSSEMYRDLYGLEIGETILQVLRDNNLQTIQKAQNACPIYLHSFNYETVKYWASHTQLPRNYLIEEGVQFNITDINQYATGIGFQDAILWDYRKNIPTQVFKNTRDLGMQVHIWTFKDDELLFNSNNNIKMYEIAQKQLKLDGVITQFSDIYAPIAQMFRQQIKSKTEKNYIRQSKTHRFLRGDDYSQRI